jgi:hypothetical protein
LIESIILVIGNLVLPYLVLSLFAMLLVELVAQVIGLRALILEYCIRNMLADPNGEGLASAVYSHPLIQSLSPGGRKPAYIPGRLFTLAFVDEVKRASATEDFGRAIQHLPSGNLRSGLQALSRYTSPGMEMQVIQKWFAAVMDQASGLYRWRTLIIVTIVAAMLVVSLNFDAIRISNHIAQRSLIEKAFEVQLEAMANALAKNNSRPASLGPGVADQIVSLRSLAFPIGWSTEREVGQYYNWFILKLIGLLASILAVMLGAPFLFDMLNKFIVVRFTIKPFDDLPMPMPMPIEPQGIPRQSSSITTDLPTSSDD